MQFLNTENQKANVALWIFLPQLRCPSPVIHFTFVGWSPFLQTVQFSSVTQSCPTLCDPMDFSTPCFPVLHYLQELAQTLVHCHPAISSCHPLLLPSIFPSMRVFSNESALHIRWPKYWRFSFSISSSMNIQGWFPLELTGLISLQSNRLSRVFQTTIQRNQLFGLQPSFWSTLTFMHDYWRNHSCDYVHFCQQSNVSTF